MPDTTASKSAAAQAPSTAAKPGTSDAAPARPPLSGHVRGKTFDFSWDSGPTAGKTQRHVFHRDGTVEWSSEDRPEYAAMDVGDEVCLVSYLAKSGYTLTVALDFGTGLATAIASNSETWMPVGGRFTEVS